MDTESQWVYDRISLYRLSRQHPDWTSRQYAEVMGRSERWVRKWRRRFDETEVVSLHLFQSQSRAPKSRPRQTPEAVKDVICNLRETSVKSTTDLPGQR